MTVGGELIYSKKATGKFPEHDEIFYHVRAAVGGGGAAAPAGSGKPASKKKSK